jgi:hypothetical protein
LYRKYPYCLVFYVYVLFYEYKAYHCDLKCTEWYEIYITYHVNVSTTSPLLILTINGLDPESPGWVIIRQRKVT